MHFKGPKHWVLEKLLFSTHNLLRLQPWFCSLPKILTLHSLLFLSSFFTLAMSFSVICTSKVILITFTQTLYQKLFFFKIILEKPFLKMHFQNSFFSKYILKKKIIQTSIFNCLLDSSRFSNRRDKTH